MPAATGTQPIRGTQSFVSVMTQVWRRPSLTALEVLWRWVTGAPLLALLATELLRAQRATPVDWSALGALTVFQPATALTTLSLLFATTLRVLRPVALWLLPVALLAWIVAGAWGRERVLRRFSVPPDAGGSQNARSQVRPLTLFALGAVRAAMLIAVWMIWCLGVRWAGHVAILNPARTGGEPTVVGYCALLICGTLGLFTAWAVGSWMVHLAPLIAMLGGRSQSALASLRTARLGGATGRALRSRLIETNLVMGIVKIALLVLAVVFSACPLPFSSVETPTFLAIWWCGVGLLYLAAMDFFHVAHAAAYIELWRAYGMASKVEDI